jgi:hypothetical protein
MLGSLLYEVIELTVFTTKFLFNIVTYPIRTTTTKAQHECEMSDMKNRLNVMETRLFGMEESLIKYRLKN